LQTDVSGNTSAISGNATAISSLDTRVTSTEGTISSQATAITALTASVGDNTAAITAEATTRANADTALANTITALTSTVGGNTAAITAEATTRANADTALATDITALDVRLTSAESGISGNASAISSLDTRVTSAEGTISSQATAITNLQSGLSTAEGNISGNASAISSLDTRVTSAEGTISAQATAITTLQVDVGDNSTAITNESSARIAADGQIHARWGVAIDVNGNVVGRINLDGTNASSSFKVAVDKFVVADATDSFEVFTIAGGSISMSADVTILGRLDVGTGINRAFVGEVSPGSYTIRRGIAASNRVEMASNAGGGSDDYSQFRAYNSGNQLVGMLGTDAINGQGLLQLATAAGVNTLFLDGSSGRAEVAESFRGPLGSAGSLPFTFTARTGDGIYSVADGAVGIACGGVQAAYFQRNGNDFFLEMGQGRTGNGFAFIDLHGSTGVDYSLRILRGNTGVDAPSTIAHKGNGALQIVAESNAEIQLWTNGVNRLMVNDVGGYFAGVGSFGGGVTAAGDLTMTGSRTLYNNGVAVVKTRQAAVTRPAAIPAPSWVGGSDWTFDYITVESNFTAVQNSLIDLHDRVDDLIDRLQNATGHGLIEDSA
jgi:uncharacterized coiled-coil protein SlyX